MEETGLNAQAAETTIKYLRSAGAIDDLRDAALLAAVRSMAAHLDRDPENASLWRQYREALRELAADGERGLDAELERLFSDLGDTS